MNFPAASTVLVFNVGSGADTAKLPLKAETTPPPKATTAPAPANSGSAQPEELGTKESRVEELLGEVDSNAYQLGTTGDDWDTSVPDTTPKPTEPLPVPNCTTEKSVPINVHQNPNPLALQVGNYGEVPRWRPGSVIKWGFFANGWPGGESQARMIASQMNQATLDWNKLNVGVQFATAGFPLKDLTFVVGYNAARTTAIAEAFFPNGNDLNYINVYSAGLSSSWTNQLRAVFLH